MWSGIIAVTLSTGAVLSRLGYEDSESADLHTARVLEYAGVGRLKAWWVSVWKQILPGYLANLLYLLESNVRNAAVLGFVGAGGIGLLLNEKLAWREYSKVGMILCVLYLVVLATESLSGFLRVHLVESETKHKKWQISVVLCVFFVIFSFLTGFPAMSEVNKTALALWRLMRFRPCCLKRFVLLFWVLSEELYLRCFYLFFPASAFLVLQRC